MKRNFAFLLISLAIFFCAAGCGVLLPSVKQTTKSPWNSFEEAKAAFDKITVNETTIQTLRELGFDPFKTSNIKILTYLDIINRFMPNPSMKNEDLDKGILDCINAKTDCKAYEFEPKIIKSKRYGNLLLDIFNFRRNTKESGWVFNALIVLVDDIVVYKMWSGRPFIDERREIRNPLGPLQSADDLLIEVTRQRL